MIAVGHEQFVPKSSINYCILQNTINDIYYEGSILSVIKMLFKYTFPFVKDHVRHGCFKDVFCTF